jgi:hypothetical protein
VEGHLARVQLAMPGVLILLMSPRPVPKIRGPRQRDLECLLFQRLSALETTTAAWCSSVPRRCSG